MSDDPVTVREFQAAMDTKVSLREFTTALENIRSLIVQQTQAHAVSSALRHDSIGATLHRLEEGVRGLSAEMKTHGNEDELVEKRVVILEEAQKRLTWVALVSMPSAIATWEGLKRFIGWH